MAPMIIDAAPKEQLCSSRRVGIRFRVKIG